MIVELILVAVIAFVIGYSVNQYINLLTIRMLLNDLGITPAQLRAVAAKKGIEVPKDDEQAADHLVVETPADLPQLEIRIEQHPEGLFAYQLSDGQFVAQGRDRVELMENLVMNLSNVRVVIAKEDGADLITP